MNTRTVPELAPEVTDRICDLFGQEQIPDRYPANFNEQGGHPTLLWLPESMRTYPAWMKHIRCLLSTTNATSITCLASRTTDNVTTANLKADHFWDEVNPPWWKTPPRELTNLRPTEPDVGSLS